MKNLVSKAAAIGILLYSSELNEHNLVKAATLDKVEDVKNLAINISNFSTLTI